MLMQTFVYVKDRFGIVGAYPGYKVEVRDLPGGVFVSIYEHGRVTPTRVVEGEVVYIGRERRLDQRGLTQLGVKYG